MKQRQAVMRPPSSLLTRYREQVGVALFGLLLNEYVKIVRSEK